MKYPPYKASCYCNPAYFYYRGQRAKLPCLHAHLTTAARVKYPSALLTIHTIRRPMCKLQLLYTKTSDSTTYKNDNYIGNSGGYLIQYIV